MTDLTEEQLNALTQRLAGIVAWEPGPNRTLDDYARTVAEFIAPVVAAMLEAGWEQGYSAGRLDEFRDVHDILHVRASNPYRAHEMPTAGNAPTPEGPSAVREGTVERSGGSGGRAVGVQEDARAADGRTRTRRCGTILGYGNVCGLPAGHADGCLPNEEQPS